MNERIQELADKIWAEEYWDNPATDKLLPAQLNKFAELIVWECAKLVRKYNYECIRNDEPYGISSDVIMEHFGVKE